MIGPYSSPLLALLLLQLTAPDSTVVSGFQIPLAASSAVIHVGSAGPFAGAATTISCTATATSTSLTQLFQSSKSSEQEPSTPSSTAGDAAKGAFVRNAFLKAATNSECDDVNTPPSMRTVLKSFDQLANGSDIRGKFVDHARIGTFTSVAHTIGQTVGGAALTPLAAHCLGHGFATKMMQEAENDNEPITICVGTDPRPHATRLADAFCRGAMSASPEKMVKVVYTGIATTPSMMHFCRTDKCDAAVMLTASHLPVDRNGMKFFTKAGKGGFNKAQVQELLALAKEELAVWQIKGGMPPTSGEGDVLCTECVDYMPSYAKSLTDAILRETGACGLEERPLEGLKIVFNSGNGSGGFFNDVLKNLGADVSASMFVEHNAEFPNGVPNPESQSMVDATMKVCQESRADLGIMLDTDADRSGFIVPSSSDEDSNYEPLNRNRLIALLGVLFAETSPGCTFVTDSVTSEGLADFLQQDLGLNHVRYLKGYANVISKARELTETGAYNAEVAIETSGHCAMRENDYLDDGTYTAVKVIGLLAKVKKEKAEKGNLLELISGMVEMPETAELRIAVNDESLETTADIFDFMQMEIERALCGEEECTLDWMVDEENLEGLRVRTMMSPGGFFMLRKSLHDPLISMQIEGEDREEVLLSVVQPILQLFSAEERIRTTVDLSVLENY